MPHGAPQSWPVGQSAEEWALSERAGKGFQRVCQPLPEAASRAYTGQEAATGQDRVTPNPASTRTAIITPSSQKQPCSLGRHGWVPRNGVNKALSSSVFRETQPHGFLASCGKSGHSFASKVWGAGHDFGPTIGASATAAGFLLGSPFCELRRTHVQPPDFLLSSPDKSHLHPSLGCGPGYRPITGFSAPAPAGPIPSWLQMSPWLWGPARWPQPLLASCPPAPQGRSFLGHQKR